MESTTKTKNTRYAIEREEWEPDGVECQHSMCDQFHKPWRDARGVCWKPQRVRIVWRVIDTTTGDRMGGFYDEDYYTRREAVAAMNKQIADDERKAARATEVK